MHFLNRHSSLVSSNFIFRCSLLGKLCSRKNCCSTMSHSVVGCVEFFCEHCRVEMSINKQNVQQKISEMVGESQEFCWTASCFCHTIEIDVVRCTGESSCGMSVSRELNSAQKVVVDKLLSVHTWQFMRLLIFPTRFSLSCAKCEFLSISSPPSITLPPPDTPIISDRKSLNLSPS